MSRRKRNSSIIEEAQRFVEELQTISETLDFGNGASVLAFLELIKDAQEKLSKYNKLLNLVDEAQRDVEDAEKALKAMSKRLMTNIKAYYGEDSREFQKAGGKPRSSSTSKKPHQPTEPPTAPTDASDLELIIESKPTNGAGHDSAQTTNGTKTNA